VSFGKDTKGKQRLVITDPEGVSHEYLIPKDKHVMAHDGQVVNKGEFIVDGPPTRTTSCACRVSKRSRVISRTKCRTCIGCRV